MLDSRVDLPLHSRAEDRVLLFEELNIFGEFTVGGGSDQSQLWVENPGHFGILSLCNMERCFTFLVQG